MTAIRCLLPILLCCFLGAAEGFAGSWRHEADGVVSLATFQVTGSSLSGEVKEGADGYRVSGTISGATAQVLISAGEAQVPAQLRLDGDRLVFGIAGAEVVYTRERPAGGLGGLLAGGGAAPAAAPGMAGRWSYTDPQTGGVSVAELRQSGQRVEGSISEQGMQMTLQLELDQTGVARGQLLLPNGMGVPCQASLEGGQLILLATVGMQQQRFAFSRGEGQAGAAAAAGAAPAAGADQRDPRLVGEWRHTETMISDDFSMVSGSYLSIGADGSFRMTAGPMSAGGDSGQAMLEGGQLIAEGQWRTRGDLIETREGGGPWQAVARFTVDATGLLLIEENRRRLFKRQR